MSMTPEQCRAARALLGWLQGDLSKVSNVGVGTICKFENGEPILRYSLIGDMHKALLKQGIIFLDGNGVKLGDSAYIYRGMNCYDEFFNDIMHDIEEKKCDVVMLVKSPEILTRTSGDTKRSNLERLNCLSEKTNVRCLLADVRVSSFAKPKFEMRYTPSKHAVAPATFLVFGDKLAKIYLDVNFYSICVHRVPPLASDYKSSLLYTWDSARPVQTSLASVERAISEVVIA